MRLITVFSESAEEKVKVALEQALKTQRGNRDIAVLIL
jgi:hypothetical protein